MDACWLRCCIFISKKRIFIQINFLSSIVQNLKKSIDIGHYDMLSIGSLEFSLNKLSTIINKIEKKLT